MSDKTDTVVFIFGSIKTELTPYQRFFGKYIFQRINLAADIERKPRERTWDSRRKISDFEGHKSFTGLFSIFINCS